MHAITRSTLPPQLRHFLLTLVVLADADTGSNFHGQATIGERMGVSERMVRGYFTELENRSDSPVRVDRRRRGCAGGKGRSSDLWTLVLLPAQAEPNALPTGTELPLETGSTGTPLPLQLVPQPEAGETSTGSLRHLNRKPTSGDRLLDRRSDRQDLDQARETRKRKPRGTPLPEAWRPTESHQTFAAKHGLDVELAAVAFRGHAEQNAREAVSWNGAFTTWLAKQAEWNRQRGSKQALVQQGGTIRESSLSYLEKGAE
jgi:hypothetical protein